ncbi:MAG TPA: hypothetical protein VFA94_06940 [Acidimicrobiales bacterium]|nr:hypothetical protein [Acidimicrobiales bacterium]
MGKLGAGLVIVVTLFLGAGAFWAAPIAASASLASRKGLGPGMGAFFGLILGWLGFAVVWLEEPAPVSSR